MECRNVVLVALYQGQCHGFLAELREEAGGLEIETGYSTPVLHRIRPFPLNVGPLVFVGAGVRLFNGRKRFNAKVGPESCLYELRRPPRRVCQIHEGLALVPIQRVLSRDPEIPSGQTCALVVGGPDAEPALEVHSGMRRGLHVRVNRAVDQSWKELRRRPPQPEAPWAPLLLKRLQPDDAGNLLVESWFVYANQTLPQWIQQRQLSVQQRPVGGPQCVEICPQPLAGERQVLV